jgi:hypothetical protein
MKKFFSYVLTLMLILTIFSGISMQNVFALDNVNVTVTPTTAGAHAEYQINMQIKASGGLNTAQWIKIQFPSAYSLPTNISTNFVAVAGYHPTSISVDSSTNTITLIISHGLAINQIVPVDFYTNAGIVNPTTPSTYSLQVWTETEQNPKTASFIITASGGGGGSGNSVSGLTVLVSPADSGKPADYTLVFNVGSEGGLVGSNNDYVDVYFPSGTGMPSNPDPAEVLVNHAHPADHIDISSTRIIVYIPAGFAVPNNSQCNLEFKENFGIKNPEIPGDYALQVSTSKDTGLATSNMYHIVGTAVSNASITVNPSSQVTIAEYKVVFTTSATGSLHSGTDKINIIFPDEVTLPSTVIPGAIYVEGTPAVGVTISGNKLEIVTPVNISASHQVTVDITTNFGIKNPDATGTYTVSVYTSEDTSPVNVNFTITSSQITQPTVQLSSSSAGSVSAYTISFTTGASGELSGGVDKINVIFPVGTTIPDSIPLSTVTVNNIPTTYITVYGTTVTVTIPTTIPANSNVTVIFSEDAGIKNPVNGGPYFLYVNTTKETASVASVSYTIYNVPTTTATVIPHTPDGLNGFYKTQPVITFTASSAIDPSPFIYYYFDNNSPVLYNGQAINAPEGIHTLYYYAVDHQGHQENAKTMQIKVDTVPPQLIITSPKDNAVLSSKNVTVAGTVDVGSTVKVNSQTASVDGAGHFSIVIPISGDSVVLNITAIDLAGNTSQKTIHVSVDTTPPALTVSSPVSFQEVHKLPLQVVGSTEPGATVTVNGNNATVDEKGNFTYALPNLEAGTMSIIEVVAKDAAGNTTKKTINVKYIKTTVITLQVGNKNSLVNGNAVALDAPPVIKNGRTLVPLRFVSEAFGAILTWDPVFQIIDIKLGGSVVRLQIGKNFASVNGKKAMLDVPPVIVKGRTMVPIRFVSESLDANVVWDGETKTITIMYPKP